MDKDEAQELTSGLLRPGYGITRSGSFREDSLRTDCQPQVTHLYFPHKFLSTGGG